MVQKFTTPQKISTMAALIGVHRNTLAKKITEILGPSQKQRRVLYPKQANIVWAELVE